MKSMIKLFLIGLVSMMTLSVSMGMATEQGDRPLHEIHSMMVYNLMKYIHWPSSSVTGDFVIGVIGDDDVYSTLQKWYNTKKKGTQSIAIKKFNSVAEIADCHAVYIGKSESSLLADIKAKLSGKSTLIITNKIGLGKKGSAINFKIINNKLKFELNRSAIDEANLKVSGQLMAIAILI